MPNWCDNTLFIYGKDDDITWIEDHFNDYAGRRCDDAYLRKEFAFIQGNTVFSSLVIMVRTGGSGVYQFLQLILHKYKNIHIKWHYYIELGCGAGDVELGKDKKGNFYEFFTEIDQDPYKDWAEYEYELIQEFPQDGEHKWDAERIQQPHWYEEDDDIEFLLPYELYTDAECYLSVWHGMLDNHDWVTYDTWLEGYYTLEAMDLYDELERKELEEKNEIPNVKELEWDEQRILQVHWYEEKEDIPTKDELEFDQCRTDHQAIFATADNECFKIKNVEQYERNERELNSILISDDMANEFLKDLEEQTDMPTEKELWYDDLRVNGTYEDWCEYMDSK
jgi:hypothetical protein